jgi:hypothetical protein
MGALFMGDASYLAGVARNVAPVTDNYPLRISSELVRAPGRIQLYAAMMDERDRLDRFTHSDFIAQVWPRQLAAQTPPYFRYEGLIKDHFTEGVYPPSDPAFLWQSIDEVLADSRLETLPLWLLGTDRDVQRNVFALVPQDATRPDVALEIVAQNRKVSVGGLSLLLYLLGKSGRADDARTLVATLDGKNDPEVGVLIDWFESRFDAQASVTPASSPR